MTGNQSHLATFLRFALVGGGFSLGYALITTTLINFAATPPLPTSVVIYVSCIPLAFIAQRRFAFRDGADNGFGLPIYAGTQVICLAFVSVITSRFVSYVFWIDMLLYLVTAGVAAVASYVICRFVIFRAR